jgi:hypothetical protein
VGSVSLKGNSEAARVIEEVLDEFQPDVVVSGGAAGIDSMAADAAYRRGILVREYKPKRQAWRATEMDGFWARNIIVAFDCDVLVRIVASDSKTYGSGWTRDRAQEMGKPTREYTIDV